MIETVQALLKETAARYADRRLHLFDIRVESGEGQWIALSGRVLEAAQLQALRRALRQRLPDVEADLSGVVVLRKASPRLAWVATNLTSLHAQPSWLAEMLSQNTFGTALEVLEEHEKWALVRQQDGYLGWMYLPYLSQQAPAAPTHLVCAPVAALHAEPAAEKPLTSRLLGGTAVSVSAVSGAWAEVGVHRRGWVQRAELRPIESLPQSPDQLRAQIAADAPLWMGVPYLWGGCSAHGIDCSGLAQLIYRLAGISLPRDADMQFEAGRKVEPPYLPGDLLFFGEQGEKRAVTHVGISLGGWKIIHSSRSNNGVDVDDVQAVEHLRSGFLGAATFIPHQ